MTDNPYQSPNTEPDSEARQPLGLMAYMAAGLAFLAGLGGTLLVAVLIAVAAVLVWPNRPSPGAGFWYAAGSVSMVVGTVLAIRSAARSRDCARRRARLRQERMDAIEQLRGRDQERGSAAHRSDEQSE